MNSFEDGLHKRPFGTSGYSYTSYVVGRALSTTLIRPNSPDTTSERKTTENAAGSSGGQRGELSVLGPIAGLTILGYVGVVVTIKAVEFGIGLIDKGISEAVHTIQDFSKTGAPPTADQLSLNIPSPDGQGYVSYSCHPDGKYHLINAVSHHSSIQVDHRLPSVRVYRGQQARPNINVGLGISSLGHGEPLNLSNGREGLIINFSGFSVFSLSTGVHVTLQVPTYYNSSPKYLGGKSIAFSITSEQLLANMKACERIRPTRLGNSGSLLNSTSELG